MHKASVTIIGACTAGMKWKMPTTTNPSATEIPQPAVASPSGRPLISPKSSSMPAMNNVTAMAIVCIIEMNAS